MRHDQPQRIFMFRTNGDEMNVQAINFGDELRQCVEACLHFPPVVFGSPIGGERLHRSKLHALRCILDIFPFRPPFRQYPPPQIGKVCVRDIDAEGPDAIGRSCRGRHRFRAGLRFGQGRSAHLGGTDRHDHSPQKMPAIITCFFRSRGGIECFRCIHSCISFRPVVSVFGTKFPTPTAARIPIGMANENSKVFRDRREKRER